MLEPADWGPHLWYLIHIACLMFDKEHIPMQVVLDVIETLRWLLPCERCKAHFHMHLMKRDIHTIVMMKKNGDKYPVFKWSYDLHCDVSRQLEKSQPPPSFESILAQYLDEKTIRVNSIWFCMFVILAPISRIVAVPTQFILQRYYGAINFILTYWVTGPIPTFRKKTGFVRWLSSRAKHYLMFEEFVRLRKLTNVPCKNCAKKNGILRKI